MEGHDAFAALLRYPDGALTQSCATALAAVDPETRLRLLPFTEAVRRLAPTAREELFTQTFDINPVCCLEVAWHLYGEDYARGAFLVRMRQLLRQAGVEETAELPDHLCHLLPLLGRLPSAEADELATRFVLPALERMLRGFEGRPDDNPYRHLLQAAEGFLRARHGAPVPFERAPRPASTPGACACGPTHPEVR